MKTKVAKLDFELASKLAEKGLLDIFMAQCDKELELTEEALNDKADRFLRTAKLNHFDPTSGIKQFKELVDYLKHIIVW